VPIIEYKMRQRIKTTNDSSLAKMTKLKLLSLENRF